jgi:hypothetical protein
MSNFQIGAILEIKDVGEKLKKERIKDKKIKPQYQQEISGTILIPKKFVGAVENVLERDGIRRRETEYVVRICDPKGDINKSITKNYTESYLLKYARLLI